MDSDVVNVVQTTKRGTIGSSMMRLLDLEVVLSYFIVVM